MSQLDQVIGAIDTFYAPTTPPRIRQETGKLLESFQNTVLAWNASIELISQTSNPIYSLFAAQTLKHKIVLDWRQLDEPAILGLRERLWSLIFPNSTGVILVSTVNIQLKLALAALIVQIPINLWTDPIGDLFNLASQNPGKVSSVLELLSLIPEQLGNRSIQSQNSHLYHEKCSQLLERHIDSLIQMVLQVLQSPLEDRLKVSKDLLICLLSWIQFGGNGSKIIESPEFLDGLFSLLHSSCAVFEGSTEGSIDDDIEDIEEHLQIIETCSELLIELIVRMSGRIEDWDDNQTSSDSRRNDDWFSKLGMRWIPTLSRNLCKLPILLSLQLRKEELMRPLITLTCEALELFLSSLLEGKDDFFKLSESILAVSECPGIPSNILELTFNFWAALPVELSTFDNESGRGSVEERQEPFIYLFSRLFTSLLRGPLIFKVDCNAEEVDKFREFRHVVGDCLKDCVRVLGSTEALLLINSQLTARIPLIQREAALFALRTISSSVDPRESEAMPLIAPLLLLILQELLSSGNPVNNSNNSSIKMISAVVLNVGCYSEWLRYHSEFMGTFLQILSLSLDYSLQDNLIHLENPSSIIGSSLQSLKYMCESCAGLLGNQYSALESLFIRVYPWSGLSRRDRLDLSEAVTLVLSRRTFLSDEEFVVCLNQILNLIWNGGPECLEDYAVVLECIMLPELPRTPLIFSNIFSPSFNRLIEIFQVVGGGGEESFCKSWLRVIQAALNNGTAGSVTEFTNGVLMFWMLNLDIRKLSAMKQGTILSLTSSLISGQFLTNPELLPSFLLKSIPIKDELEFLISERLNLMRVCIIYVHNRPETLKKFSIESGSFELLETLLKPNRILSSLEIVSMCGYLSALFGALECDGISGDEMIKFYENVIRRICEVALLEWPLTHINDLSMLLSKSGRPTSPLNPLTVSLFSTQSQSQSQYQYHYQSLLTSPNLFDPSTSTPHELQLLSQEYPQVLSAATKNYRPKGLRLFLKNLAETCRRRRT